MPSRVQPELDIGVQRGARHALPGGALGVVGDSPAEGEGPASGPGLEQTMGVERRHVGVMWGEEFVQHPLEVGAVTSVVTVPPLSTSERLSESFESKAFKGLGKSSFCLQDKEIPHSCTYQCAFFRG